MNNITLFCASSNQIDPIYFEQAAQLALWLGRSRKTLIYGGANVGLMEHTAQIAKQEGAYVIGVIPEAIEGMGRVSSVPHLMIRVADLAERKKVMMERADLFIVLPGGAGTLDEVFEVMVHNQLQLCQKPILFWNPSGYWNGLKMQLEAMSNGHFTTQEALSHNHFFEDMNALLSWME